MRATASATGSSAMSSAAARWCISSTRRARTPAPTTAPSAASLRPMARDWPERPRSSRSRRSTRSTRRRSRSRSNGSGARSAASGPRLARAQAHEAAPALDRDPDRRHRGSARDDGGDRGASRERAQDSARPGPLGAADLAAFRRRAEPREGPRLKRRAYHKAPVRLVPF